MSETTTPTREINDRLDDFLVSLSRLSDPGDANFDGERIKGIRERATAILAGPDAPALAALASAPVSQKAREDDGAVEITTIRWRDASKENPPEPHKSYEAKLKDGRRGYFYYGNRPGIKEELEWYYYQNSAVAPVTHFALVESVTTTEALTILAPDTRTEYDRAIDDLAKYLPDGWVCQGFRGVTYFSETRPICEDDVVGVEHNGRWRRMDEAEITVPIFEDWKKSIRRIKSGKVVPHV